MKIECLRVMHDDFGHQGIDRTESILKSKVYWPFMREDIGNYTKSCKVCMTAKAETGKTKTIMKRMIADKPMEVLAVDFCVVDKASNGRENILVVTDLFSKFVWAFDLKDQKATTVAKVLVDDIFYEFAAPRRIHSDQGRNFESKLISEICKRFEAKKSRTSPYHPEGNGQCERFNRTLFGLLRQLSEEKRRKWHLYLKSLIAIYNMTPHSQSGFSPYFLLFGREPRLPLDL